ncbi:MAG: hypothetical protein JW836_16665 [Deltaproteobacteria bacterium]|nr:hypothetical protein [Deltaproteobacteria bacterium]
MGVSLKTEKRRVFGVEHENTRGGKGGRRGFTVTSRIDLFGRYPGRPPPASPFAQS